MRYIEKAGISCIMRMYLACKSKYITKIIWKYASFEKIHKFTYLVQINVREF